LHYKVFLGDDKPTVIERLRFKGQHKDERSVKEDTLKPMKHVINILVHGNEVGSDLRSPDSLFGG
jgi:hypothetical protein